MDCPLLAHPAIGWDFDGTLIDHPNSAWMHRFIHMHPEKEHVILTFRTHGYERSMFDEMQHLYPGAPSRTCFARVLNIENLAWEQVKKTELLRQHGFRGPFTEWERYYMEWKGMTCHRLNIPVLVDDRHALVLPGCRKYSIEYIHPDEL